MPALWVKVPGESDGSCDIAGGGRAWDFDAYNPWGVQGEDQLHFDPLWGADDPAAGEWFHEQALELALNANPPLFGRRLRVRGCCWRPIRGRQTPAPTSPRGDRDSRHSRVAC
jgi:cellulase/cellobiase CelA1